MKTEAWVLRNLITTLTTAAKRPHIPRSPEFRKLFKAMGIVVPEGEDGALAGNHITLMCVVLMRSWYRGR